MSLPFLTAHLGCTDCRALLRVAADWKARGQANRRNKEKAPTHAFDLLAM